MNRQPDATIVTKNYPDDAQSRVEEAERWRLNIHVGSEPFAILWVIRRTRSGQKGRSLPDGWFLPHPDAPMGWVASRTRSVDDDSGAEAPMKPIWQTSGASSAAEAEPPPTWEKAGDAQYRYPPVDRRALPPAALTSVRCPALRGRPRAGCCSEHEPQRPRGVRPRRGC